MRVPISPNQEGTMEMKDENLSSIGAKDMDASGYQVSGMDDVDFHREIDQMDVDAVFRPGIDKPFPPSIFNNVEMCSIAENPFLIDEEQDKDNSPPPPPPPLSHPTTPVSERPTQPPVLMRCCPFGTRIENVPEYVPRILFEKKLVIVTVYVFQCKLYLTCFNLS